MEKNRTVEEACQLLSSLDVQLASEQVSLFDAFGRVLAEEVTAVFDVPSFRKSAYDGYALRRADIAKASPQAPVSLKVTETIAAGRPGRIAVTTGTAARIMTGAMIPEGADVVIKHEDTRFTNEEVCFFAPAAADHIVAVGEDVKKGVCLLQRGTVLDAADLALLAGQGRGQVTVYRRPMAALLSTGSELLEPGQLPEAGKIYHTNAFLLGGYLKKYGLIARDCGIVDDDPASLAEEIEAALEQSDLVLTTGGVSAGDFDYVEKGVEQIGARVLFHRLPMKPGGAMLAAVKDKKLILGLSGNPAAAAVGLLRVALPYLKKLCGRAEICLPQAEAVIEQAVTKRNKGIRLLRGKAQIKAGRLVFVPLDNQKNGAVSSMADCDLLGEIPADCEGLAAGDPLKVYFV